MVESPIKGVKEEVESMLEELLFTDAGKNTKVFARINRAELGDFDALVLGLFLMAQYQGQIIVPDGGFYLNDIHLGLAREDRLIAGVRTLSEPPRRVRDLMMLCDHKTPSRATTDDAAELAHYDCKFPPAANEYNAFIERAMVLISCVTSMRDAGGI